MQVLRAALNGDRSLLVAHVLTVPLARVSVAVVNLAVSAENHNVVANLQVAGLVEFLFTERHARAVS